MVKYGDGAHEQYKRLHGAGERRHPKYWLPAHSVIPIDPDAGKGLFDISDYFGAGVPDISPWDTLDFPNPTKESHHVCKCVCGRTFGTCVCGRTFEEEKING